MTSKATHPAAGPQAGRIGASAGKAIYIVIIISALAYLVYEARKQWEQKLLLDLARIEAIADAVDREARLGVVPGSKLFDASATRRRFEQCPNADPTEGSQRQSARPGAQGCPMLDDFKRALTGAFDRRTDRPAYVFAENNEAGALAYREAHAGGQLPRLALYAAVGGRSGREAGLPVLGPPLRGTLVVSAGATAAAQQLLVDAIPQARRVDGLWQVRNTNGRFILFHSDLVFAQPESATLPGIVYFVGIGSLASEVGWNMSAELTAVLLLAFLLILVRNTRASEHTLRRLLDASPIPLALLDRDLSEVLLANVATLGLFGGARSDDPQDVVRQALTLNPAALQQLGELVRNHHLGRSAECQLRREDEQECWVIMSAERLAAQESNAVIVGFADITERRKAEEMLRRAKNAAEAANRSKSEFLAMLSHELRTPINGILGTAQLITDEIADTRHQRMLQRIVQAAGTLSTIINDILDYATLEVDKVRLNEISFDLREAIVGSVSLMRAAAAARDITVDVSVSDDFPHHVLGDPARLQQILMNLLSNATKFTEHGSVSIEGAVIERTEISAAIRISVSDTGIGIPEAVRTKLFQPFSQADEGIARRYGGTGLGLAICKRLVEAMAGQITFDSEVGKGTTFHVCLAFRPSVPELVLPRPTEARLRALIVDDVPINLDVAAELVMSLGHEVTMAASGEEAVRAVVDGAFDVVLMDIHMPGMDGIAATRAIREMKGHRSCPFIIGLTADIRPTSLPLYHAAGIDAVVPKPIERRKLYEVLTYAAPGETSVSGAERVQEESFVERVERMAADIGGERTARVLELYLATSEDATNIIGAACANLSFDQVAEAAHRLAGAALNLGLNSVSRKALSLEELARGGPVNETSRLALATVCEARRATVGVLESVMRLSKAIPGEAAL